jgi:HK97 gp10 family phage protein
MKVTFKFLNVKHFLLKVNRDERVFEEYVDLAVDETANYIENRAKRYCPVDTGKLRASIQKSKPERFVRYVSANTEYAKFVEYGTRRTRPQPYMNPATDEAEAIIDRFLEKAIRKFIK